MSFYVSVCSSNNLSKSLTYRVNKKLQILNLSYFVDDDKYKYYTDVLKPRFFLASSLLSLIPLVWFMFNSELRTFSLRRLKEVWNWKTDQRSKTRNRLMRENCKIGTKRFRNVIGNSETSVTGDECQADTFELKTTTAGNVPWFAGLFYNFSEVSCFH